jgi:hypothetical protein
MQEWPKGYNRGATKIGEKKKGIKKPTQQGPLRQLAARSAWCLGVNLLRVAPKLDFVDDEFRSTHRCA